MERTIAHYKVLGKIGEGGMGEVYRAQDTRLGRDVAIKVLPEDFTRYADRVKRFEREAQLLASLNHPHIAAIYGLEHDGSAHALVMELVEGPTLADRLSRGALPVDEALEIARQIAQALEYAHERGIVHRDLKPANIKITSAGDVKVLDFGLAKALGGDAGSEDAEELANSPTRTSVATEMGVLLGTATYMAPEQARGRPVDRRADVWAFGAVLYEMLTGARAFRGAAISEILASVMRDDPDFRGLPAATPARVRELVERCLTKDVRQRLQAVGEARIALERAIANPDAAAAGLVPAAAPARAAGLLPWAVAVVFAIAAAVAWMTRPPASPAPAVVRMTSELSRGVSLVPALGSAVVLSPDGRTVAFRGRVQETDKPRIFVRRLSQHDATPLAGTDDVLEIFFSRDSEWITFNANGKLKKVRVTGCDVQTICDVTTLFRGGDWTEDGHIVFATSSRGALSRVSADGGQPEPFTKLDTQAGEITHRFPQVLPGGTVLYTSHTNSVSFDEAQIMVQPPGRPAKVVIKGGYVGRYVATGHLLFLTKGTLFAVPFDLDRLETTGAPVPVAENVANTVGSAGAQFSVSNDGTLAYLAGAGAGTAVPVLWLDASGETTPLLPPGPYLAPQLSSDGRKLALQVFRSGRSDIVVHDLERGITTPFAEDRADEQRPIWTPDGKRIVYSTDRDVPNRPHLEWKTADGSGVPERLTTSDAHEWHQPGGWDRDGRKLFFVRVREGQERQLDVMVLPFDAAGKPGLPTAVLEGPANDISPALSPDGRWLVSRIGGNPGTVVVRRYPEIDGQVQVSLAGGTFPTWSRSANELFYLELGRRIMVVSFTATAGEFRASKPRVWAEAPLANLDDFRNFDVHPDGKRLVILPVRDAAEGRARTTAEFVFGLGGELRRIAVPGRR